MTVNNSMIHIRVGNEIKKQATAALNAMGLSVSEAVRLFMYRMAADQAFPFKLSVPNAETHAAMVEAEEIAKKYHARFLIAEKMS